MTKTQVRPATRRLYPRPASPALSRWPREPGRFPGGPGAAKLHLPAAAAARRSEPRGGSGLGDPLGGPGLGADPSLAPHAMPGAGREVRVRRKASSGSARERKLG